MKRVIGVDFDNTIVSYDDLILRVAVRRNLIPQGAQPSKKDIRDRIRRLPDGENEWQRVQAAIYGPAMKEAKLIDGVLEFFQRCRQLQIRAVIVSHKTEFANFDRTGTNLRQAALSWMKAHEFFESSGFGLSESEVFFESTRAEKIERIRQLGCTHFIDDLEEVFSEDSFPSRVVRILYAPQFQTTSCPGVKVATSWSEASRHCFDEPV